MLDAVPWARDSKGAHMIKPMKMVSPTKTVERGFDLRTLILM